MDPELVPHSSDDEETLAMKESLLQIKLRKKLLAKASSTSNPPSTAPARSKTPPPRPLISLQNPFASPKSARLDRIQVPASPSPQKRKLPVSPARVTLGIDKGRTGRDISLRRTPEKPKKTFNQRIAETRAEQHEKESLAKQSLARRITSFNPVPAFSSDTKDAIVDPTTKLSVCDMKIAAEDCVKVAQTVSKILSVHQFFAVVAPPDYEMSTEIDDYLVYGIIASKSTARTTSGGDKYCVLQLTDLHTDITLFLYNSAFEKYWTLPLGTLCYFLNPQFQKPRGGATKLSLKMTDHAGVLEIGKSADFGICRSIKKDGQQCSTWVNSRKQEVCDFHIDMTLSKSSGKRLEFASGSRLFDPREQSKKKRRENEEYAQHALFFGDQVTTLKAGGDGSEYDAAPVKDTMRLQREAEARQREREVLARLLKNSAASAGHEYFETTVPQCNTSNNAMETSNGAMAAEPGGDGEAGDENSAGRVFNAAILRKIGFDPTKRVYQAPTNVNTSLHTQLQAHSQTQADVDLLRRAEEVDLSVRHNKGSSAYVPAVPPPAAQDFSGNAARESEKTIRQTRGQDEHTSATATVDVTTASHKHTNGHRNSENEGNGDRNGQSKSTDEILSQVAIDGDGNEAGGASSESDLEITYH